MNHRLYRNAIKNGSTFPESMREELDICLVGPTQNTSNIIFTVSSYKDLKELLNSVDATLGQAAKLAYHVSGGRPITVVPVPEPYDDSAWVIAATAAVHTRKNSIVPLTDNRSTLETFTEAVEQTPQQAKSRRHVWQLLPLRPEKHTTSIKETKPIKSEIVRWVCVPKGILLSQELLASSETEIPVYFACVALAALRAGCAPNEALTGIPIPDFRLIADNAKMPQIGDDLADMGAYLIGTTRNGCVVMNHPMVVLNGSKYYEEVATNLYCLSQHVKKGVLAASRGALATRRTRSIIRNYVRKLINNVLRKYDKTGKITYRAELNEMHNYVMDSISLDLELTMPSRSISELEGSVKS